MSTHTATPYRAVAYNSTIAIHGGPNDVKVATVPKSIVEHLNGRSIADAAFIVKACNSHDALITNLRNCIVALQHATARNGPNNVEQGPIADAIAALKLAES